MVINLNEPIEWIKFNCDQIGYYRVNYSREEWATLFNVLQKNPEVFIIFKYLKKIT